MEFFFNALYSTLPELPAWILVATGFYFSYRILKFPDLTVDASFTAGMVGAACGAIVFQSSFLGLIFALLLSSLAGLLTSFIYMSNPRPAYKLLAGVFVIFAFYSVNYRIIDKKTEVGFANMKTAFNFLADYQVGLPFSLQLFVGIFICILVFIIFRHFLKSHLGIIIRSIGSRPNLEVKNINSFYIIGLILSNSVVGLGGWYYSSINSYANINVFGTIIHALAIAIIGELLLENLPFLRDRRTSPTAILISPILGAIIYQFIKTTVTYVMANETGDEVAINQQDNNAFVAVSLILLILFVKYIRNNKINNQPLEIDIE